MRNLPLDSYASYYGLGQNTSEHREFMQSMSARLNEVINQQWCCICQKTDKAKNRHQKCDRKCDQKSTEFSKKFTNIDDIESLRSVISPKKSHRSRRLTDIENSENSAKKQLENNENDREFCDFCPEGFVKKDFYKHMAIEHFQEEFITKILPTYSDPNGKCRMCKFFKSSNQKDLILHLAETHKLMDRFYHHWAEKPSEPKNHDIIGEMVEVSAITKTENIYKCKGCGISYTNLEKVIFHVRDHFKQNWPLPNVQPYICPECFYEAATYLSLFKHVGTTHGQELKSIWNKEEFENTSKLVKFDSKKAMEAKTYTKKHFTITQPKISEKPKVPKVKFLDFMAKEFQDVKIQAVRIINFSRF